MGLKKMIDAYRKTFEHYLDPIFRKAYGDDIIEIADEEAKKLWQAFYTLHGAGLITHDTWSKFYHKCHDWEMAKFISGEIIKVHNGNVV